MKTSISFSILICMISMFLFSACENAEIQKTTSGKVQIEPRLDDCTDCPVNDCCCYVELANPTTSANLTFCGVTNPEWSSTVCGPVDFGNCATISGYYWFELLDNMNNPNEFFCVTPNTSFMLGIASGSANLNITCQYGQLNPQTLNVSLSAPNKLFFNVDGECGLELCHE